MIINTKPNAVNQTFPISLVIYLVFWACTPTMADDEIKLIKTINVPGNFVDRSGLSQEIEPGIWHDLFGGISALEYTGKGDLYYALPDRGPKDGAIDWTCRFHLVSIKPNPIGAFDSGFTIKQTTPFLAASEKRFSGSSTIYEETPSELCRLDPEGIRQNSDGQFWVSDEYGPHVLCFNQNGKLVRRFDVPEKFKIKIPGPDKATENAANDSGRQGNRGMEGLAISDDGTYLYGLMQSPLLQDCKRTEKGKPTGLNCRLLKMNTSTGQSTEYLYPLDHPKNKLNEILRLGNNQFLVIERDGEVGEAAKFKKIMKIDISRATEIQSIASLPAEQPPERVIAIQKEVYIDLLDPRFGLAGAKMPEKIESLAFGPKLEDGRQLLLIVSDNDFNKHWPTKIFCFAVEGQVGNDKQLTSR